jgi:hypothetical protein
MEIFFKLRHPKPSVPRHSAAFSAQEKTIFNLIFVNSTTFSVHTILVSIFFLFFNKVMIAKLMAVISGNNGDRDATETFEYS